MAQFSLRRLGAATERALRRFPLAMLAATVAGVAAAVYADDHEAYAWRRLLLAAQLGIPLFLVIALVAERRERLGLPRATGVAARAVGVVLLGAYVFALPDHLGVTHWLRFVQLNVGLHLLVTVLPFARRGETNGMWQFNLALLLRFVTAAFFSAVLFAGLSLALFALKTLLAVPVADEVYLQLWCLIAFVFNTAYVLGGVPADLAALDAKPDYPRVVRIFAQDILAPLVGIYLAILLVYLVKVIATGEWPSGWIGYLVSSVAVAGLLSLLLLEPLAGEPRRRWLRVYARGFYALMLPSVAMLALAVVKRTDQYGLTEPRYFLSVLAVWLGVVAVAGSVRRLPLVKAIPASLAALAFLTAAGPWSAYDVARASQRHRLDTVLAANGRLRDGRLVAAETPVADADREEISAVLDYLFEHFGAEVLGDRADPALGTALADAAARTGLPVPGFALARIVTQHLNVAYVSAEERAVRAFYAFTREPADAALPTGGFAHVVAFAADGGHPCTFTLAGDTCRVAVAWEAAAPTGSLPIAPTLTLDLAPVLAGLRAHATDQDVRTAPAALLAVAGANDSLRVRLEIDRIDWFEENGLATGGRVAGTLLITTSGRNE